MQNITSQKFAEMCNCTATNIRNLRASGTLVAQQDEKGNWLFDLDLEENRAYYNKNKKVSQPVEQVVAEASQFVSQADGQGVTQSLCTSIEKLTQQLEKSNEHALLAGKALMLESNIIEKQKDVDYWREKYFKEQESTKELSVKVSQLENSITQLTEKHTLLESENQQLNKKSFFGLKFGK